MNLYKKYLITSPSSYKLITANERDVAEWNGFYISLVPNVQSVGIFGMLNIFFFFRYMHYTTKQGWCRGSDEACKGM